MKSIVSAVAIFFTFASLAHAGQTRVTLCHATSSATNPYVLIKVAEPAYATHIEHGDFPPNEEGLCIPDDGGGDDGPPGGVS